MKKLAATIVAIVLLGIGSSSPAQAQTGGAPRDQEYKLLPGLDKDLINTQADACVDFFQYACGNFSKLHPIPNDRSRYGAGTIVDEHNEYVLHTMLEKAAAGGAERTPIEQKIGD